MLTDEAIRNGSLRKNTKKRGNGGESSRDGNVRDENKRFRTRGRHFAKDSRTGPRMVIPVNVRNPTTAHWACFECGVIMEYLVRISKKERILEHKRRHSKITVLIY
nr:hypothetical protein [Tanacetum cinerariifolium]